MKLITINIDSVDLELLDTQRRELHELLLQHPETYKDGNDPHELWGLLGLLDHICDKYEVLTYSTDNDPDLMGECDTCGAEYELASRDGRCGDCGECADHCDHECEHAYSTDGEQGICMFCGKDEETN